MARSIVKFDPTYGIKYRMVIQVERKQYQFEDPCIICGQKFNGPDCTHEFHEVQGMIDRIKKLSAAQKTAIYRREKGQTMNSKTPAQQADELVAKANEMLAAAEKLRNSFAYPEKPDWMYSKITIQFRGNYRNYTYLVYMPRTTTQIFTTGTQEDTAKFANWEAFIDWLRGDDVISHGLLNRLTPEPNDFMELP